MVRWADGHQVVELIGRSPVVTERTTREDVMDMEIFRGPTIDASSVADDGQRSLNSPVSAVVDSPALIRGLSVTGAGAVNARPGAFIDEDFSTDRANCFHIACLAPTFARAVLNVAPSWHLEVSMTTGAVFRDVFRFVTRTARGAGHRAVLLVQTALVGEGHSTGKTVSGWSPVLLATDHRTKLNRPIVAMSKWFVAVLAGTGYLGHRPSLTHGVGGRHRRT